MLNVKISESIRYDTIRYLLIANGFPLGGSGSYTCTQKARIAIYIKRRTVICIKRRAVIYIGRIVIHIKRRTVICIKRRAVIYIERIVIHINR